MTHPVFTIATFTLLEAIRDRFLWILLIALFLGLGLAEFVGDIAITESAETKSALLGAALRLFAVWAVSLFATTSLVREFTDKTLELTLALPIPRASYYFGKLLGVAAAALVTATLIGLCLALYVPLPRVAPWALSLTCELLLVGAFSLLSALSFHQVPLALSAVAGFYLLSRAISAIQLIGHGPLADPNSLAQRVLGQVIDLIAYLLPELHRFTPGRWLMYGGGEWSELQPILIQTGVYLTLLIGAGLFDLYRKSL
jgi:ABC-type transport system involved in multi-copper enzyme maturation permease subunit